MTPSENTKSWAKELKALAQTGLEYTTDVFDMERYKYLNNIANQMLASISTYDVKQIDKLLPIETGYATPKIAVRAIILKDSQILMVKESLDELWALPGGWCDIGLTAKENAEKEVLEETGLHTKATKLISFFDQSKYKESITMQHIYTVYFLCEIKSGKLQTSIETTDIDFFNIDSLPPISTERMTRTQFDKAITVALQEREAYFD